jgi:CDP-diacylglycerol pyrophosphatase
MLSAPNSGEDRLARPSPAPRVGLAAALGAALLAACRAGPAPTQASSPPAGNPSATCVVAAPPNSLWSLAQCCARNLQSDPGCRYYSEAHDFIILKDNSKAKPAAYLIIPTMKVTGIEDPQIFLPPVADFWAHGWKQGQIYLKRAPANTALAINSEYGRTQNQLHIHISCLRPDVAQDLAVNARRIGGDPANPVALALGPHRNSYRVIKITSLVAESPFELAAAMPGAKDDMAAQSIAVAGAQAPGTYFVLDTYHHGNNPGAAEELLEQSCRAT